MTGKPASDELARIKDVLVEHPLGMNIKEIAAALGISRNSVAKYLDVLTASGHLEVRFMGNAKIYYLSRRVPIGNILNMAHELIVVVDEELRIVQTSDTFASFNGRPKGEILGMRLSRLPVPFILEQEETVLAGLLAGGPVLKKEIRVQVAGTEKYFNARFIPTSLEDGENGIALLFEDITRQKQAENALAEKEQLLNTIFQVTPQAYFLINRNHRIVFWNRSLEILTKIRAEEVMGTNRQWRAFYPEERPCLADLLLENDEARIESQYKGKCRKTGTVDNAHDCVDFFPAIGSGGKWLHITARVIRDASGNITGAMQTVEDVTDRKKKEFTMETEHEPVFQNLPE
ncbi:MAG: PAS fold protein [Methanoregula sp. PtaU1.Bin051]|nr:MAG: PAS fold protein [Methanoregula sp. PtaU1.Bin051]